MKKWFVNCQALVFTLFWHIGIVVYFRSSDCCYVLSKQKKVGKAEERESDKRTERKKHQYLRAIWRHNLSNDQLSPLCLRPIDFFLAKRQIHHFVGADPHFGSRHISIETKEFRNWSPLCGKYSVQIVNRWQKVAFFPPNLSLCHRLLIIALRNDSCEQGTIPKKYSRWQIVGTCID